MQLNMKLDLTPALENNVAPRLQYNLLIAPRETETTRGPRSMTDDLTATITDGNSVWIQH